MNFQAQMNLANFNPRPEKAGKGVGKGAADLKLVGKLHLDQLKNLFKTPHGFSMLEGLYDGEGNLRTDDYQHFPLSREFVGARAKLSTELGTVIEFDMADFNSLSVEPEIGRTVMLTARLQTHPTPDQAGKLFELMAHDLNVVIDQVQGELPLDPAAQAKAAEQQGKAHIGGPA